MEYVDILTMVMDSDTNTTREYRSLLEDVPTQFFVDVNMISDTPIINKTSDGRFVSIYQKEDEDIICLDYYIGGKGSFKSCTKKIALRFSECVREELEYIDPDVLSSAVDDLDHYVLCMEATVFDLHRNKVDFNQVNEKERYSVGYNLRKNHKEHYFLESRIYYTKSQQVSNKYLLTESSLFFDIRPTFQRIIKGSDNLTEAEQLAELDEIAEFFGEDEDCAKIDEYDDYDEYDEYDDCGEFNL